MQLPADIGTLRWITPNACPLPTKDTVPSAPLTRLQSFMPLRRERERDEERSDPILSRPTDHRHDRLTQLKPGIAVISAIGWGAMKLLLPSSECTTIHPKTLNQASCGRSFSRRFNVDQMDRHYEQLVKRII